MKPYSVFLIPSKEDYKFLSEIIKKISIKYKTSYFEPHVTVYSGRYSNRELLRKTIESSLPEIQPFSLQVKGINVSPNYFQTLFIEFLPNKMLENIYDTLKNAVKDYSNYTLMPHLSLIYKETTEIERLSMLTEPIITEPHIFFDEFKLVSPLNSVDGWKDISSWENILQKRLY